MTLYLGTHEPAWLGRSPLPSMAWSYRARKAALHGEGPLGHGCTHRSCSNCYRWARQWHASIDREPAQLEMSA